MSDVEGYKRLRAEWSDDRATGLTQAQEDEWRGKERAMWATLDAASKRQADEWVQAQERYRVEHGLTFEDITPAERSYIEYEGRYELIVGENEHDVVFQVGGREVTISRGVLLDYDDDGHFWIAHEDAKALGLVS